jgi:hypothetical protein
MFGVSGPKFLSSILVQKVLGLLDGFFSVPLHRGGFGYPGKEAVGIFERVKD